MSLSLKHNMNFTEKENWIDRNGGIGKALFDSMKKYFPRTAQIDARTGNCDTYETLLRKCIRLSIYLQKLGVSRNDNLCVCSDVNLDACVPIIASQFIGANFFATEPLQTPRETSTAMKQIPPKVVFTTQELFEKIKQATTIAKVSPKIITFEDEAFREILEEKAMGEEIFAPIFIDNLNDTSVFHCTSGSTGVPKVVRQSHLIKFEEVYDFLKICGCYETEEQVVLSCKANWFWSVATMALFTSITCGVCRILTQTFSTKHLMDCTEKYKISHIVLVPEMINNISADADLVSKADTSSLKSISVFGSALHPSYMENVLKVLSHVAILSIYGSTEVLPITYFNIRKENHKKFLTAKPTSAGLAVEGLLYKIVNPETEALLGPNQQGEIRVKSKKLCNYLNRDITESLDADGYYKTGDIGYYDEDFCFFIVNRIKDEFKYREWHVSPGYLENVIVEHPAVDKVVVVGKPDILYGSLPTALVILKENSGEITSEEIETFVKERVDDRLRLRGGVRFLRSFPRTVTGKVDRMALRKIVENEP